MPQIYDLYVTGASLGNAQAIGSSKPIVVFDSPLLERLGPGEQRAVLAHEVGHILSDHVLYMTALTSCCASAATSRSRSGIPVRPSGRCCSSGSGPPS